MLTLSNFSFSFLFFKFVLQCRQSSKITASRFARSLTNSLTLQGNLVSTMGFYSIEKMLPFIVTLSVFFPLLKLLFPKEIILAHVRLGCDKLMQKHLRKMIWIFWVFELVQQKDRGGYLNSIWQRAEEILTVIHLLSAVKKVGLFRHFESLYLLHVWQKTERRSPASLDERALRRLKKAWRGTVMYCSVYKVPTLDIRRHGYILSSFIQQFLNTEESFPFVLSAVMQMLQALSNSHTAEQPSFMKPFTLLVKNN